MRRLRILHVTRLYKPVIGGGEAYVAAVSETLVSMNHHVDVWTAKADNGESYKAGCTSWRLPKQETLNGVRVTRFAFAPRLDGFLRQKWIHPLTKRVIRHAFQVPHWDVTSQVVLPGLLFRLLRSKHDLVVVRGGALPLFLYCAFARKFNKVPLMFVPLLHTAQLSQNHPLSTYAKMADGIIALTEHEKQWFVDSGISDERVYVTGVGIHPEKLAHDDGTRIREKYHLGRAPTVGYVGRLAPYKGIEALILGMPHVWRRQPEANLILAGARSLHTPKLERLVRSVAGQGKGNCILIPDFPERAKADIISACDVVAMPSIGESFGITYLEAWFLERPVICCNVGAPAHIIRDGYDGLHVPYDAPEVLAERICTLFGDPCLRKAMAERGREKVLTYYTWDRIVAKTLNAYLHTAASGRRPNS